MEDVWPRQIQIWSFVEETFWPHKIQSVEFYGGCLAPSNPNMELCGGNILAS